jgi:hypothetical protein
VDGQPVNVHFLFLENGDLTAAFIKGYQFKHVYQRDPSRRRVPVNGLTVRNPKDEPNQDYAMRLALWRACHNIDGDYDYRNKNNGHDGYSLGPVGAKIYQAFREWQFEKNAPKLDEIINQENSMGKITKISVWFSFTDKSVSNQVFILDGRGDVLDCTVDSLGNLLVIYDKMVVQIYAPSVWKNVEIEREGEVKANG